jgi:isopentenyl diphosphate isomerase/L-lactate dehydrogenase-like FMN-dependent dehydrogenase
MLRDTTTRDTTTKLFGHKIDSPVVFAPIGINKIYPPDRELAVAKVAGGHPNPIKVIFQGNSIYGTL